MSRFERIISGARSRPVCTVFVLLAAVPSVLAVFSFRQPVGVPHTILSELELLFQLFVYVPVAVSRLLFFDPLGLEMLFSVPGLEQVTILLVLLGFYYLVSVAVVRVGGRLYGLIETAVD